MTKSMPSSDFARHRPATRAALVDGLPPAIDQVAHAAPPTHQFLRRAWFAAAVAAYGGAPRTIMVEEDGVAVAALPIVARGPRMLGLAQVAGSYWPFRSFPLALSASTQAPAAMIAALGSVRALRIGPVYDGDAGVAALVAAAREAGWGVLERHVAPSWTLDMAAARCAGDWPRASTLRKNRSHEKHLAAHGALDWGIVDAQDWASAFAAFGAIESSSWIAASTDGSDAKFLAKGHLAFWQAVAADPAMAAMLRGTLLTIAGTPAAFTFEIEAGVLRYAIATGYAPRYARHSPGKLIWWRNLVDALAHGVDRVDLGAGDSGYKQVIGAEPGPALRDWMLLRPGLPAAAGRMLRGVWARGGSAGD